MCWVVFVAVVLVVAVAVISEKGEVDQVSLHALSSSYLHPIGSPSLSLWLVVLSEGGQNDMNFHFTKKESNFKPFVCQNADCQFDPS